MSSGPLRHLHLVRTLAARELTLRYRGSMLGFAWALITPVASVILLSFVFGHVLGVRWPGASATAYPVYLFSGLVVHGFLADCIQRAPNLVVHQANYVHRASFPLAALGWVMVAELLVPLAIGTAIVPVLALVFGYPLRPTLAFVPLALAPLVPFGVGIGWLAGALGVYLRDLGHTTTLIATGMLFFSPVLYPLSRAPAELRVWYLLNPTTRIVENFRALALDGTVPDALALGAPLLVATVWAFVAWRIFERLREGFADVL